MKQTSRKLSRRDFLRLSSLVAAGTVLSACGTQTTPDAEVEAEQEVQEEQPQEVVEEPPAPEPVTLEYWMGWSGETPLVAEQIAAKFKEEVNPNVTINITGAAGELWAAAIAGGTLPALGSNVPYLTHISQDLALPIDDMMSTAEAACVDDIPEGFWGPFSWKGKKYGIPGVASFASHGLGYNIDLVEEAGLDPNNPPETWDEVFEWHKALTKYDAAGNLEVLGIDVLDAMAGKISNDPWFWPKSWGFDFINEDNLEFDIDRPETVEIFETIKRFYDDVGAENMEGFRAAYATWTYGPNCGFPAGAQAMIITGSWSPGWLGVSAPDKNFAFTWMPVPASRRGKKVQTLGGHTMLIYKGTEHAEEAFEFEKYVTCNDSAAELFFTVGFTPGRATWWKNLKPEDYKDFDGFDFFIDSITGGADELWSTEANPVTLQTNDEFVNAREAVIYGELTPVEAAKQMQDNCTKAMQDMFGS